MADVGDCSGSLTKPEWNTVELPPSIEIKESSVKKGDAGAFSKTLIPEDTRFGPYKGDIIMAGQKDFIDYRFAWEVYEKDSDDLKYTISAINPKTSNWMRHVNCARFYEEQNILSVQDGYSIFYVAMKDIKPGEELLTYFDPKLIKRTKRRLSKMARKPVGYTIELVPWDDEKKFVPEIIETKRARKKKVLSEDMIALDEDPLALTRTLQRLSKIPCTPKQLALSSSYRGMSTVEHKNKSLGTIKVASLVNASALSKTKKESKYKSPVSVKGHAEGIRVRDSVLEKHSTKIVHPNHKDQFKKITSLKVGPQKPTITGEKRHPIFCSKNSTESSLKNKGMKNVPYEGPSPIKFVTTRVTNSTSGDVVHEEVITVKPVVIKQNEDGRTTVEDHDESYILDNLQLAPQCDKTCHCLDTKTSVGSCSSEDKKQDGFVIHFTLLPEHKIISCDNQIIYRCDVCDNSYNHAFSLKRHYLGVHINHRYLSREDILNCQIETFHTGTQFHGRDAQSESLSLCNEKPSFVTKHMSSSTIQFKNVGQNSAKTSVIFINKLPGNTTSDNTQHLKCEETLACSDQDKAGMIKLSTAVLPLASIAQIEVDKLRSNGVALCGSFDSKVAPYGSFNSSKLSDDCKKKEHHTSGACLECDESLDSDLLCSDGSEMNCDASIKGEKVPENAEVGHCKGAENDKTSYVLQTKIEKLTSDVAACNENITQDTTLLLNDIKMFETEISITDGGIKPYVPATMTTANINTNQTSENVFDIHAETSEDGNIVNNCDSLVNCSSSVALFSQSPSCSLENPYSLSETNHNLLEGQTSKVQEKYNNETFKEHAPVSLHENIFQNTSGEILASRWLLSSKLSTISSCASTIMNSSYENMQANMASCGLSPLINSDVVPKDYDCLMAEDTNSCEVDHSSVSHVDTNISSCVELSDKEDIEVDKRIHILSEFGKCTSDEAGSLDNKIDDNQGDVPACAAPESGVYPNQCSQLSTIEPTVWDTCDKGEPCDLLTPLIGQTMFPITDSEKSAPCINKESLSTFCVVQASKERLLGAESAGSLPLITDSGISVPCQNMDAVINSCKVQEVKERSYVDISLPEKSAVCLSAVCNSINELVNSSKEKRVEKSLISVDLDISFPEQSPVSSCSISDSETSVQSKHMEIEILPDTREVSENYKKSKDADVSFLEKSPVSLSSIVDMEISTENTTDETCKDQVEKETSGEVDTVLAEQSTVLLPHNDSEIYEPCKNENTFSNSDERKENNKKAEEVNTTLSEHSTLPLSSVTNSEISAPSEKSVMTDNNVSSPFMQETPSSSTPPAVPQNQTAQQMIFLTNIVFPVVSSSHNSLGTSASPCTTTQATSSMKNLPAHATGVPLVVISRVPCGVNIQNSANAFLQSPATLKAIETIKNSISVLNLGSTSEGQSLSGLPSGRKSPSSTPACGDTLPLSGDITPLTVTTTLISPSKSTTTISPSTSNLTSPSVASTFIISPSTATTTLMSPLPKGSSSKCDQTTAQPLKPVTTLNPSPFTSGPSFVLFSNKMPIQKNIVPKTVTPSTTSSVSPKKSPPNYMDQPDDLYRCHMCVLVFRTMNELKQHIRNDPHRFKGGLKQYGCQQCSMRFSNKNNLTRHNLMNHPENENYKFRCFTCGKGFMSETYLKMHARFHTGKNFPCKYGCVDVYFPNAASLVKHLRTHHAGLDLKEYLRNIKFENGRRRNPSYMVRTSDDQVISLGSKETPETVMTSPSPCTLIESGMGFLAKRGRPKGSMNTFKDVKLTLPQREHNIITAEESELITDAYESDKSDDRKFRFECALCLKGFGSHLKLLQHRTQRHGANQSVQEYLYEMSKENLDEEISDPEPIKFEFSPPPSPTTFFNNVNKRGFENMKHYIDGNIESLKLRKKNFAVDDYNSKSEPLGMAELDKKMEWTVYNFPPCFEYKADGTTFYDNSTKPNSSQFKISSDAEVDKETSKIKICSDVKDVEAETDLSQVNICSDRKDVEVDTDSTLTQNVSDIKSENVPNTAHDTLGHSERVKEVDAETTSTFHSEDSDASSIKNASCLDNHEDSVCSGDKQQHGLLKSFQQEKEKELKQILYNVLELDHYGDKIDKNDVGDSHNDIDNSEKSDRVQDICVDNNDRCSTDDKSNRDDKTEIFYCGDKIVVDIPGDKHDICDYDGEHEIDDCDEIDIHDQTHSHRKQACGVSSLANNLGGEENEVKSTVSCIDDSLNTCTMTKEPESFIRNIVNEIVCSAGQGNKLYEMKQAFHEVHSSFKGNNEIEISQNEDFKWVEETSGDCVGSPDFVSNVADIKVECGSHEDASGAILSELLSMAGDKQRTLTGLTREVTQKVLKSQYIQAINLEMSIPDRCCSCPKLGGRSVSGVKSQSLVPLLDALDLAFRGKQLSYNMMKENLCPSFKQVLRLMISSDKVSSLEPGNMVAQNEQSHEQIDHYLDTLLNNSDSLKHDHRRYHIWAGQSHDKLDNSSKENSFCQPVTEAVKKQAMMQQMAKYQCEKLERDKEIEEKNDKFSKKICFAERLGLMTTREFEVSFYAQKEQEFVIKVPEVWERYENIWFGKKGNIAVVCSVCHRHFSCWDLCLRHQLKKHPHIEPASLEMEKDNFVEDMFYYYPMPYGILAQTHLIPENLPSPEVYVCTRCGFPFKNLNRLHAHMIICDPAQEVLSGRQTSNQNKPSFMKKKLPMVDRQLFRNLEQPKLKSQSIKQEYANEVKPNKSSADKITKASVPISKNKTLPSSLQNKNLSSFSFYSGRTQKSYEIVYNPQNHTRRREQYKVLDQHQCHGCNLKFESLLVLERHVNKCSGRDKLQNQKPLLSGIMPDDAALKKQHTCRYCNKRFTYFKGVDLHYKRVCAVRKVKEEENKLTEEDLAHEMELNRILEHIKWSKSLSKDSNDIIQGRVKVEEDGTLTPIVKQATKKKDSKWTSLKRHHPDDDDGSCDSSASSSTYGSHTKYLKDAPDKKVAEQSAGKKRLTRSTSQESVDHNNPDTKIKKKKTSTCSSPVSKAIKIISKSSSTSKSSKNGSMNKHCNNKKSKLKKKVHNEKVSSLGMKQKKANTNTLKSKKVNSSGSLSSVTSPKLGHGQVTSNENLGIKPPARKRGRPERFDPSDMESSYKKKKKSDDGYIYPQRKAESVTSQVNGRKVNSCDISLVGTSQMRQKTGVSVKGSSDCKSHVANKKSPLANVFNNSALSSKKEETNNKNAHSFESNKLLAKMKELKEAAKAERTKSSQGRGSPGKVSCTKDQILGYSQKGGDAEGKKDKKACKNVGHGPSSLELLKHLTKEEVSHGKNSSKSVSEGKRRTSSTFLPIDSMAASENSVTPVKHLKITTLNTSCKTATSTTEKLTDVSVSSKNSSSVTSGVKTISKTTAAKGTLKLEVESKDLKKSEPVLLPTISKSSTEIASENEPTNTARPCSLGLKPFPKSSKQPALSVRVVSLSPNGTSLITHDDPANIPRPSVVFSKSPQVPKCLSSPTQNIINTLSPESVQSSTKSPATKELQKTLLVEGNKKPTVEKLETSSINQIVPAQPSSKLATAGSDIITEKVTAFSGIKGQLSQKSVAYQIKVVDNSGRHGPTSSAVSECGKNVIVHQLRGTDKPILNISKPKNCKIELVIPEELNTVPREHHGFIDHFIEHEVEGESVPDYLESPLVKNVGQIISDSTESSKMASACQIVPDSTKSLKRSPAGQIVPKLVVKPSVHSVENGVTLLCTAAGRSGNAKTSSVKPQQSLLTSSSSQTCTTPRPQPPGQIIQTVPSTARSVNQPKPKPTNIILVHAPSSAALHGANTLPLTGSHKAVVPTTPVTAQVAAHVDAQGIAKIGSPAKLVNLSGTVIPNHVQTSTGQTSGRVIKIASFNPTHSTLTSTQPQKVQGKRVQATTGIIPATVSQKQPIILNAGQIPKLVTPGLFHQRPSLQQPVATQGAFTQSLLHTSPGQTKLVTQPAARKPSIKTVTHQLLSPPSHVASNNIAVAQPSHTARAGTAHNTIKTNNKPKQSFVTVSPNSIMTNQIMITLEDGTTALLDTDSLAQFLSVSPSLTKLDPISVASVPSHSPDPMNPMVVSVPETLPVQKPVDEISWPANGTVDLTQPDGADLV